MRSADGGERIEGDGKGGKRREVWRESRDGRQVKEWKEGERKRGRGGKEI